MYYLVDVDNNSMAAHLTRTEKGFKKCCISGAVDGTEDGVLWNGCEDGDSDTLTGKGKLNLTCFLY
jgi:hypothetical protein